MTVDKNSFASLLRRFASSTTADAEAMVALKGSFPYSQVIQTLVAKLASDHELDYRDGALQEAAIHAADRAVLKDIMNTFEDDLEPEDSQQLHVPVPSTAGIELKESINEQAIDGGPTTTERPEQVSSQPITSFDGVDVADQVLHDLERLNTLKHNFEMMFVEYTEVETPKEQPADLAETKHETSVTEPPAAEVPRSEKHKEAKSKKERIIELARSMHATDTPVESPHPKKKMVKGNPNDELIEEIATSKQEIVPESARQKEQIDIINQFIKSSPTINNSRERQMPPPVDLNTVKSGEFGDNVVSETLVEILIKQGKKEKAVEVLKKLIWKYPQKKAYFASQIEELKK